MSPNSPEAFAVILSDPAGTEALKLARALAAWKKIPELDLIAQAKRSWGVVEENLNQAKAEEEARALSQAGIAARAVLQAALPEPPPAKETRALDLAAVSGRLRLIAAAAIKETRRQSVRAEEGPSAGQQIASLGITLATGIPIHIGGKKTVSEKTVESSELFLVLDLILAEPFERLRLEAGRFDFSCLREKKAPGSAENFRRLIEEIRRLAPQARLNRGARLLTESKPWAQAGYESPRDLEREERWLLALGA